MPSKSGSSKQEPTATTPLTASSASAAATPASSVNGALSDPYIRGVVFLLSGALFGAALQRGRVHESLTVVAQMTFSRLIMLKMFLAASGTAALVVYFLENVLKVPTTRDRMTSGFKRGLPFVAGGAALLGIGMTLSGSCPGTVYAQIGAGSRNAWVILLGGFVGAGLYSLLDAYLAKQDNTKKLSEGRLEGSGSFVNFFGEKTPLFIGGGMLAFVFILELLVNWKSDLKGIENHATFSTANPAIVSGILIGLVQFPLIYFSGKQLGSSTSFVCMLGNCVPSYKESPWMNCARGDTRWQVLVMLGVVLGSFLSSSISQVHYVSDAYFNIYRQFLGGIFIIFGAQLGSGCTSGHGLSGLAYQSLYSLVAVASMFGAAIATGMILA